MVGLLNRRTEDRASITKMTYLWVTATLTATAISTGDRVPLRLSALTLMKKLSKKCESLRGRRRAR